MKLDIEKKPNRQHHFPLSQGRAAHVRLKSNLEPDRNEPLQKIKMRTLRRRENKLLELQLKTFLTVTSILAGSAVLLAVLLPPQMSDHARHTVATMLNRQGIHLQVEREPASVQEPVALETSLPNEAAAPEEPADGLTDEHGKIDPLSTKTTDLPTANEESPATDP